MNTYENTIQRNLDYDLVLTECYEFNTKYLKTDFNYYEIELILLNYLSFIENNELSLKLAIQSGFKGFFEKVMLDF